MTQAGVLSLDVVPNLTNLGTQLEQGLNQAVAGSVGTAATKAGESIATKIGGGLSNLGSQIGGELGNLVGMVGRGFDQIGKSGDNLGLKFAAAGGAALGLGTALKSLGSADSAAQQQLQAAITATGHSWGDYQGRIEDAIHAGENFAHNAADTQNALQALTSATGDPAKALKFLSVAFDLAAARHIDLVSAANLVARALNGNTRLLKQYGIDTTGVATSTDKASTAVTKLGDKLSGQAAASVNTFNGTLDVLKTKAGDIVAQLSGPVGSALQGFGAATALVGGVIQSGIVQKMRTAFTTADTFGAKMRSLRGVLVGSAGLAAAVVAVGIAFNEMAKDASDVQNVTAAFASGDSTAKLKATFDTLSSFPDVWDRSWKNSFQSITHSTDVLKTLGVTVQDVQSHVGGSDAAWQTYRQSLLDASDAAGFNGSTTGLLAVNLDKLREGAGSAKAEMDALGTSDKATAAAAELARKAYDDLSNALTSFNNLNIDAQKADIATRDSLVKVNDALKTSHGSLSLLTQKGRDARSATLDFAASVDKQAQALIAEGKPHSAIVALYQAQDRALQATLVKMGLSRAEAKRYADSLLKIPASVTTKVTMEVNAIISAHLKDIYAAGIHHTSVPLHPAGGGLISGGGTATSDSVPIMASRGEVVMSVQTVERVGANKLLRVNAGGSLNGGGNTYNTTIQTLDPAEADRLLRLSQRKQDLLFAG